MNLPPDYLTRPHVVFDVESFGLHGGSFAVGAVLVKLELADRHDRDEVALNGEVVMRELQHLAATDKLMVRPWTFQAAGTPSSYPDLVVGGGSVEVRVPDYAVPGGRMLYKRRSPIGRTDFNWLQANIPDSVFEPKRLTDDLSIFELFDAFVEAAGPDVMLWAECPVPVEANFLNELRRNLSAPRREFWKSFSAPILHDIASLADPLLGLSINRLPHHLPAHDPLNDSRASARRLELALSKILQL